MRETLTFPSALLWVAGYLGVMLLYTALDVAIWRKTAPAVSGWLDLVCTAAFAAGFLALMQRSYGKISWTERVSVTGVLLALVCAAGFYVVLDLGVDPLLAKAFPGSESQYQEAVQSLLKTPAAAVLKVCVIAPIMEETLIRWFLLGGLRSGYGDAAALAVSTLVFALLHFNMVQTLSALVCGAALGLLFLHTGSILCCILAHCGYNLISCAALLANGTTGR